VWAFDFEFDQTADGRALKLLNVVDEFTRESLVMLVERSIDADRVVAVLEGLVAEYGAPELLRCDTGPEMTAHALGDWCALSRDRHRVYRAWLAVAEPVRGIVPPPACVTSCSTSRSSRAGRSARGDRRLARGLQLAPPARRARD
jgi:hypothetical protein